MSRKVPVKIRTCQCSGRCGWLMPNNMCELSRNRKCDGKEYVLAGSELRSLRKWLDKMYNCPDGMNCGCNLCVRNDVIKEEIDRRIGKEMGK